jgi:uncharacterized protein (TIGR02444 family)
LRPENPFWAFSLAAYAKPGVADACLFLQDNAGLDVNLLLYCCWIASVREQALTEDELRNAVGLTAEWREQVVSPLRQIRRGLRGGADGMPGDAVESFRSEVKRLELASERMQQDCLFAIAGPVSAPVPRASWLTRNGMQNISLYLSVMDIQATPEMDENCRRVADGCAQAAS